MLEARVGGAGIDEKGMAELADVAQALEGGGVDDRGGGRLQRDVLPQEVADHDLPGGTAQLRPGGRRWRRPAVCRPSTSRSWCGTAGPASWPARRRPRRPSRWRAA